MEGRFPADSMIWAYGRRIDIGMISIDGVARRLIASFLLAKSCISCIQVSAWTLFEDRPLPLRIGLLSHLALILSLSYGLKLAIFVLQSFFFLLFWESGSSFGLLDLLLFLILTFLDNV